MGGRRKRPRRVAPAQRRVDPRLAVEWVPGPIVMWDGIERRIEGVAVTPGILPGLPGGEEYVGRAELEAFADERVREEVRAIRSLTLAAFIAAWDRSRYGGRVA